MLWRGFFGSTLILVAGLGVAVVPASSFLLRIGWVADTRASDAGQVVGALILWVGVAVLAREWLRLVRGAHADDDSAAAIALVRRATLIWSLPLLVAPPLFSRDGWSYAAQGDLLAHGMSPYQVGPGVLSGPIIEGVDPRWYDTATPYGPLPLSLGSLGARLTENPWTLVIGYRLLALVGLVLLAWAVPRLAQWGGVRPAWASAVVLASPLMLGSGVGGLHNDLLMTGLMAAALVVGVERGWAYGAVLAGLAAAVKAPGGFVAVGIALAAVPAGAAMRDRLARLVGVAAVALATLFGLGFLTGVGAGWLRGLTVPGLVTSPLSVTTVVGGLVDLILEPFDPSLPAHLVRDGVRDVGTVVGLVLAVVIALWWRTGERRAAIEVTALVVGVVLVTSPVVQPWYLLWLLPFVPTLRLNRLWTTTVVMAVLVWGCNASIDGIVQRLYFAIAEVTLIGILVLAAQLLTGPGRARLDRWRRVEWLYSDGVPRLRRRRLQPT